VADIIMVLLINCEARWCGKICLWGPNCNLWAVQIIHPN